MKASRWICLGLVLLAGAGLANCARGVAEFQLYSQAFDAQFVQGEAILDSVAKAERTVVLRGIRARSATSSVSAFVPEHAPYYVDGTEPPITASIRASLKTLKTYNAALGGLANGEAAEALTNRVGTLTSNILGALAATSSAFSGAAGFPGADALLSQSGTALQAALPIVKQIAAIAARETFRQELILTYPHMKDLLLALRAGTPAMFEILKRSRAQRANIEEPFTADGRAALEKDRALLAAWVVLMDKTLVAMDAAAVAVLTNSPASDLASLSEASLELRVLAEQIKAIRNK